MQISKRPDKVSTDLSLNIKITIERLSYHKYLQEYSNLTKQQ